MIVIILEKVSASLRGELSRWLIEPHTGVFVGHISAMVRDRLWAKICSKLGDGGALMLYSTNNEQRFAMEMFGYTKREIVDFDGLQLVRIPFEADDMLPKRFPRIWKIDREKKDP